MNISLTRVKGFNLPNLKQNFDSNNKIYLANIKPRKYNNSLYWHYRCASTRDTVYLTPSKETYNQTFFFQCIKRHQPQQFFEADLFEQALFSKL